MPRLTLETPADVRLLDSGLSVGEALAAFNAAYPEAGGIATFLGKVRPDDDVRVLVFFIQVELREVCAFLVSISYTFC